MCVCAVCARISAWLCNAFILSHKELFQQALHSIKRPQLCINQTLVYVCLCTQDTCGNIQLCGNSQDTICPKENFHITYNTLFF